MNCQSCITIYSLKIPCLTSPENRQVYYRATRKTYDCTLLLFTFAASASASASAAAAASAGAAAAAAAAATAAAAEQPQVRLPLNAVLVPA